jgi:tetratricopeptide (TPR) repeat protein
MDDTAYRALKDESVRLIDVDDYAAAAPLAKKALASAKRLFDDAHVEMADCLYNVGTIERLTGKWKKAIATLEKAAAIYEGLGSTQRQSLARALADAANVLVAHGEHARAKPLAERAVAGYRAAGVRDEDYAIAVADLACCAFDEERYADATTGYEEVMTLLGDAVREQLYDSKSRWGLSVIESDAVLAAKLFDETLALSEGLAPTYRVNAWLHAAACAVLNGRAKDGEEPAQRALDLARSKGSNADLAAALFRRGDVHVCLDQHAQAVPLLKQAVEIQKKLKHEPTYIEYVRVLGDALNGAELHEKAAAYLARVYPAAKRRASVDADAFDDIEYTLIDSLYEADEPSRAKPISAERVERLAREAPESIEHVKAIEQHAMILDELGETKEARALYDRVIALREKNGDAENLAVAWQNLAMHAAEQEPPDWVTADDAYIHSLDLASDNLAEVVEDLGDSLDECPRVAERAKHALVK